MESAYALSFFIMILMTENIDTMIFVILNKE